ncbi:nitroreductase family protein [Porphyromonas pogonae]|uniref:nitroreductase family protein n=1 Tax=Porphyromonas pogonae TaxID=867595 RepID=UPI002E77C1EE|nr:nitroreductase family protein [Porphyromonas pogonae]
MEKSYFYDLINSRQSDRKYDPEREIPEEVLMRILEAGRMAPSANNGQPWGFILVTEKEQRRRVADCCSGRVLRFNNFAHDATAHILIIEEKPILLSKIGGRKQGVHFPHIDIGITAAYLTLAATAEGIGSCIQGWFDEKELHQILGLPENKKILLNITLGYSLDKHRTKRRKELSQIVHKDKW